MMRRWWLRQASHTLVSVSHIEMAMGGRENQGSQVKLNLRRIRSLVGTFLNCCSQGTSPPALVASPMHLRSPHGNPTN